MSALTDVSFEDWIEHAFSHEVREHGVPWFFDVDAPWWNPPPAVAVDYLTRLFLGSEKALEYFSDAQIAQGLTYLVNTSASGDPGWLYARVVPVDARQRCIQAIHELFTSLFARRCAPVLSHIDEPGALPLNGVCYMWWDTFPCFALPDDPDFDRLQQATLAVMRKTLALDSIACQEGALHGLGHSARAHPQEVGAIIDEFLRDPRPKREVLVKYARSARCGCVL
jgi:hypothetical protein